MKIHIICTTPSSVSRITQFVTNQIIAMLADIQLPTGKEPHLLRDSKHCLPMQTAEGKRTGKHEEQIKASELRTNYKHAPFAAYPDM